MISRERNPLIVNITIRMVNGKGRIDGAFAKCIPITNPVLLYNCRCLALLSNNFPSHFRHRKQEQFYIAKLH